MLKKQSPVKESKVASGAKTDERGVPIPGAKSRARHDTVTLPKAPGALIFTSSSAASIAHSIGAEVDAEYTRHARMTMVQLHDEGLITAQITAVATQAAAKARGEVQPPAGAAQGQGQTTPVHTPGHTPEGTPNFGPQPSTGFASPLWELSPDKPPASTQGASQGTTAARRLSFGS